MRESYADALTGPEVGERAQARIDWKRKIRQFSSAVFRTFSVLPGLQA
jgi:hypothetical protein